MDIKDKFDKFYDWLLNSLEFNMEMIEYMDFGESITEELLDEYLEVEKIIERFYEKILFQVERINTEDIIARFSKIIDNYYDEYYDVIIQHKHDIFHYSYLLGWYRDIPYELFIFARNLNCSVYGDEYYEDVDNFLYKDYKIVQIDIEQNNNNLTK